MSNSNKSDSTNNSKNVEKTPEDRFCTNINGFIDLFKQIIEEAHEEKKTTLNPMLITIASMFVSKQINEKGSKFVIENFIKKTKDHWKEIKASFRIPKGDKPLGEERLKEYLER